MKSRRRFLATGLATGVLALQRGAFAHGGPAHADKPATAPAGEPPSAPPREQQPWGIAGDAAAVVRTIPIVMSDAMRFVPDRIEARLAACRTTPCKIPHHPRILRA